MHINIIYGTIYAIKDRIMPFYFIRTNPVFPLVEKSILDKRRNRTDELPAQIDARIPGFLCKLDCPTKIFQMQKAIDISISRRLMRFLNENCIAIYEILVEEGRTKSDQLFLRSDCVFLDIRLHPVGLCITCRSGMPSHGFEAAVETEYQWE